VKDDYDQSNWRFSDFFQNTGRHSHDFFNLKGSTCVTLPNFVAIGQTIAEMWLLMAALWNRASHYIFPCGFFFYLLLFLYGRRMEQGRADRYIMEGSRRQKFLSTSGDQLYRC